MCELRQRERDCGSRSPWRGRSHPALEPASSVRGTQEPTAARAPVDAHARPALSGMPAWSLQLDVHVGPWVTRVTTPQVNWTQTPPSRDLAE